MRATQYWRSILEAKSTKRPTAGILLRRDCRHKRRRKNNRAQSPSKETATRLSTQSINNWCPRPTRNAGDGTDVINPRNVRLRLTTIRTNIPYEPSNDRNCHRYAATRRSHLTTYAQWIRNRKAIYTTRRRITPRPNIRVPPRGGHRSNGIRNRI